MTYEDVELPDVIGRRGKYQTIATLAAIHSESILGVSYIFLQFMFVDVNLYWDWDTVPENRTSFQSATCKMDELLRLNSSSNRSNEHSRIVYETKYLSRTLTEKFDTVCERAWLISFTKSLPSLGATLGCLVIGPICDKLGRRRTCFYVQFLLLGSNLCILLSPCYPLFAVACFCYGVCTSPAYIISVMQITEIIPTTWRPIYGTFVRYGTIIGHTCLSGVAWILEDWFNIQIFHTFFTALSIPFAWYVIDSPAWLIVRGRDEDAKTNLRRIIQRNRMNFEDFEQKADLWIKTTKEKQKNKKTGEADKIKSLFKNIVITKYTVLLTVSAFFSRFAFLGLMFNVETFGSGLYQDVMIFAGVTFVGVIVAGVFLIKYSIKKLQVVCLLFATVDAIGYVFTYEFGIARTVTGSLFRGLSTPVQCTSMVYMAELFPTSVRVVGSGFVTTFSNSAVVVSPFVKDLGEITQPYVPFIFFAALTFVSALCIMFLPETKNKPLIHTVAELQRKNEEGEGTIYYIQTRL